MLQQVTYDLSMAVVSSNVKRSPIAVFCDFDVCSSRQQFNHGIVVFVVSSNVKRVQPFSAAASTFVPRTNNSTTTTVWPP